MTPLRRLPLATRAYAAALWLCPPSFRRQYAEQMRRDFEEARLDAIAAGAPAARLRLAAQMTLDLARTIAVQWVRGGALAIGLAAMLCSLSLAALLAGFFQRVRIDVQPHIDNLDVLFVVLMVAVVVVLLASTIIFTQWFAASIRRPPPRRRRID